MLIFGLSVCAGVLLGIWIAHCLNTDDKPKASVEKPKNWVGRIAEICPICDETYPDHYRCERCSKRCFAYQEGILKNPYNGELLGYDQWEKVEIILATHTGEEAYQLVLGLFQPKSSVLRQRADAFVERRKRRTYAEIERFGNMEQRETARIKRDIARTKTTVYVKQRLAQDFPNHFVWE